MNGTRAELTTVILAYGLWGFVHIQYHCPGLLGALSTLEGYDVHGVRETASLSLSYQGQRQAPAVPFKGFH